MVLKSKGLTPRLILHPLAKMTTPYDVFQNRIDAETLRHGSCGLGIGKTMKRNEGPFKLYAVDLLNKATLLQKMISIKNNYYEEFPFGIEGYDPNHEEFNNEMSDFMKAIDEIKWEVENYSYLKLAGFTNLIFEGSQGILLDMDHGVFPHVTYANTTSKNALEILDKLEYNNSRFNIVTREIYYVTRCYSTRHGGGYYVPQKLPLINNENEINVTNEFQKDFKVAPIDYDLLNHALKIDEIYWMDAPTNVNISTSLVVTCMDQLKDFIFDYSKLNTIFVRVYESFSPESAKFRKSWRYLKEEI